MLGLMEIGKRPQGQSVPLSDTFSCTATLKRVHDRSHFLQRGKYLRGVLS